MTTAPKNKMEKIQVIVTSKGKNDLLKKVVNANIEESLNNRSIERMNELTEEGIEFY